MRTRWALQGLVPGGLSPYNVLSLKSRLTQCMHDTAAM